jgi:PBP1b-binding outer membrane lipoprotein LpoB
MQIPRLACVILVLALVASGCKKNADPDPAVSDAGKLNAGAPTSVTRPDTAATQVDPEEPKAGMNTARPDSLKDVTPAQR